MINAKLSIVEQDARRTIDAVDFTKLKGRRILITGASGLIGTHLIACLRELQHSDNALQCVTAVVHSENNTVTEALMNFKGARLVRGDLTEHQFVRGLGKFEYIIHAAGYGQPGRFLENQVKTLKLNTSTTLDLFDALEDGGRFLFVSTSEVYSGLENPPYSEEQIGATNTTHPRSCYIEAKRCGEAICNAFRTRGVHASSARLALAYGPGTKRHDHRVINSFIERGITSGKIALQDMGAANRTYCYVSDAIEILWQIALHGNEPIYNVGGFSKTTIANLARTIGDYLGVPVEFPRSQREMGGSPSDVELDMRLVRTEFGKTDYVPFPDGIARTIAWQQELYK